MYDFNRPGWHASKKTPGEVTNHLPSKKASRKKPLFILLTVLVILSTAAISFIYYSEDRIDLVRNPLSNNTEPSSPEPRKITPTRDEKLEKLLGVWAESHSDHEWSVSIKELNHNLRFAQMNPGKVFTSASIYKLLLTYPLFQDVSLEQAKGRQAQVNGAPGNLLDCVSAMLKVSDNPCGHVVGSFIGWAKADVELKKIGLSDTKLNSPDGSLTSAEDTAQFLKALYGGQLFDQQTKDYIIETLRQSTWRDGIAAGCAGCVVANKTGDLGVRHDAAIVEQAGRAYVLVIFTDGAPYSEIAGLTKQIHAHMKQDN